jgi:hypothetical protein
MNRFVLALAVTLGMAGSAFAQEDPTGWWTDETSAYYFARGGSATDGTYLYLFGGYQLGVSQSYPSYYRRSRRYDPAANTWVTLANLPIVESDITYQFNAGAYYDGRLYSFGTSYLGASGIVLSYSLADDAWIVLDATVPAGRFAAAAAVLGDLIYLAGGYANGPSRRVDAFDPSDGSFSQVADLPAARHLHAMAAVPSRNALYVVGGMSADGYEGECYEYSAAADAWTERAPLPVARGYLAAFTLRNRVYAAGGRSNSGASPAVFEYHPGSDSWRQRASMAAARYQHAGVAISGRGYVYGGLPVYSEGEEFTPPDFGPAPELESPVTQSGNQPESSLQAKEDPALRDGWMNGMILFRATISDPDPGQAVRLRIRMRRPLEPEWFELQSGLVAQGIVQINYWLPTPHSYDWEYRIEDAEENSFPAGEDAWLPAFGNDATPDVRCDRTPPTPPAPLSPIDADLGVADPSAGDATFRWIDATDNGPVVHDLEISREGLDEPEAVATIPAGVGAATIRLSVSGDARTWRMRARDLAGNATPWSDPLPFRVVHDDRLDHAAGDGRKTCAFGAGAGARGAAILLALVILLYPWKLGRHG